MIFKRVNSFFNDDNKIFYKSSTVPREEQAGYELLFEDKAHGILTQSVMTDVIMEMQEEKAGYELLDEEERPDFVPTAYDSLRLVPSYGAFIKDRFERCAQTQSAAEQCSTHPEPAAAPRAQHAADCSGQEWCIGRIGSPAAACRQRILSPSVFVSGLVPWRARHCLVQSSSCRLRWANKVFCA